MNAMSYAMVKHQHTSNILTQNVTYIWMQLVGLRHHGIIGYCQMGDAQAGGLLLNSVATLLQSPERTLEESHGHNF